MPSSSARCSAANVRPKSLPLRFGIFFLDQMQHSPSNFQWLTAIRRPASIPMLEPFPPRLPVPPPQSLGLAIAQLEHDRGIAQLEISASHSSHHFYSLQLTTTHGCPFKRDLPGWRSQSKGTFLSSFQGTLSKSFNREIAVESPWFEIAVVQSLKARPDGRQSTSWSRGRLGTLDLHASARTVTVREMSDL